MPTLQEAVLAAWDAIAADLGGTTVAVYAEGCPPGTKGAVYVRARTHGTGHKPGGAARAALVGTIVCVVNFEFRGPPATSTAAYTVGTGVGAVCHPPYAFRADDDRSLQLMLGGYANLVEGAIRAARKAHQATANRGAAALLAGHGNAAAAEGGLRAALTALGAGGGGGEGIAQAVVTRGHAVVDAMVVQGNPASTVTATADGGGIVFYWPAAGNHLTVEVEADGALYVHAADLLAGNYTDGKVPASTTDLAAALAPWLTGTAGSSGHTGG